MIKIMFQFQKNYFKNVGPKVTSKESSIGKEPPIKSPHHDTDPVGSFKRTRENSELERACLMADQKYPMVIKFPNQRNYEAVSHSGMSKLVKRNPPTQSQIPP